MTVHDDLATGAVASLYRLTDELPAAQRLEAIEHVRRVEAEIARLERERDEAWFEERRGIDAAGNETVSVWCRRCGVVHQSPVHCPARNGAAEAEVARLRDGLRRIVDGDRPDEYGTWHTGKSWRIEYARALLADQDGAARLPGENGWNYPPPTDAVNPGGAA